MAETQRSLVAGLIAGLFILCPAAVKAEEPIEKAGVAVGVTAGNLLVVPIKAISMTVGVLSGALSYVVTGGNKELTEQIWQDTLQGPYVVTPELARSSIGYRPELEPTK